ncbi:MAG TPA: VOC family protein [Steroidobacteraceae bacterium]|nr:VOC family protein [Steroidobacteraceae bacterium]
MRIDHIAVWTEDLDRLAHFYATYFSAVIGPAYSNASKGFESRFLSFADGARLEIMRTRSLTLLPRAPGVESAGLTHLAVSVGSERGVEELTARLRQDGHTVLLGPRRTGDGYYESVILDPDGNRIEITA